MRQIEMPIFQKLEPPEVVDSKLIEGCKSFQDALLLCLQLKRTKYDDIDIAAMLREFYPKLSKQRFSTIKQGKGHLPGDCYLPLQWICGNWAITQWQDYQFGCGADAIKFRLAMKKAA